MKRIIAVSLVLIALLIACVAPVYAQEKWVTVETFDGKGDKTTSPFTISGSKWRVNWRVEAESPEWAVFGFFIYPEGETTMYVESVSHTGSGSDTTYIYKGKGSFYIKVHAANLKSWTIEVENCISAAPPKPKEEEEDNGCLIATAAYGTDTAQELDILREFRDEVLLPDSLGSKFVSFYYTVSPPIAKFISEHNVLRTIVREGFVEPIVVIVNLSHNLWSE